MNTILLNLICPVCKKPKKKEDFFFRKGRPDELIFPRCKDCQKPIMAKSNRKKAILLSDKADNFLAQYFD